MKRFLLIFLPLILLLVALFTLPRTSFAEIGAAFPPITIRDGKLYAGDEEFFLNAVGYSGIRPGKTYTDPIEDEKYGYDLVDLDMQRIKEAGFNAIRTYSLLDEKIIELAAKHGLWVAAGIWTDQNIQLENPTQVDLAMQTVAREAKIYARHPNVAMLLLINEPNPAILFSPMAKEYLAKLAKTAKENSAGIPVTFSNMPNAVFVDPAPWDIISFNIYASASAKFQKSLGYRGYVEGVRKLAAGNKPFFISEYGFYAAVPKPHMDEPWISFYVDSDEKQAEYLVRDQSTLSPLRLSGATLMLFHDDWRNFGEVPGAERFLQNPKENKKIHDMFTQEWGGLVAFDADIKGVPRPAYYAVAKSNQALMMAPDPEEIFEADVPVRLYVTEQVAVCDIMIDGKKVGTASRVSPHWMEYRWKPAAKGSSPVKHQLAVKVYYKEGKPGPVVQQAFWTGTKLDLPRLTIEKKGKSFKPEYIVRLTSSSGKPLPQAKVQWGLLDIFKWEDFGGDMMTNEAGEASFVAPRYGVFLAGAGYEFHSGEYTKRITDLFFSR